MTRLSQAAAIAFATAATQVRDWDHAGILHALKVERDKGTSAEEAFHALAEICRNPDVRTPGFLNQPGAHWHDRHGKRIERRGDLDVRCIDHTDHVMPCQRCKADTERPSPEQLEHYGRIWREALAEAQDAARQRRADIHDKRQEATR